jgi:type VI secretion system protein ImpK
VGAASRLVALHREAWGGEKFFEMLDRICADPPRHIDLMELQYLILALGFTGKYHMLDRGQEQLADLQRNLSRTIRSHRGSAATELSLQWRGLEDAASSFDKCRVAGRRRCGAILAVTLLFYSKPATRRIRCRRSWLRWASETSASAAPAAGPTLKRLLRPGGRHRASKRTAAGLSSVRAGDCSIRQCGGQPSYEDARPPPPLNQVPDA